VQWFPFVRGGSVGTERHVSPATRADVLDGSEQQPPAPETTLPIHMSFRGRATNKKNHR